MMNRNDVDVLSADAIDDQKGKSLNGRCSSMTINSTSKIRHLPDSLVSPFQCCEKSCGRFLTDCCVVIDCALDFVRRTRSEDERFHDLGNFNFDFTCSQVRPRSG